MQLKRKRKCAQLTYGAVYFNIVFNNKIKHFSADVRAGYEGACTQFYKGCTNIIRKNINERIYTFTSVGQVTKYQVKHIYGPGLRRLYLNFKTVDLIKMAKNNIEINKYKLTQPIRITFPCLRVTAEATAIAAWLSVNIIDACTPRPPVASCPCLRSSSEFSSPSGLTRIVDLHPSF